MFWYLPEVTFINQYHTQLQIGNNNIMCVFQSHGQDTLNGKTLRECVNNVSGVCLYSPVLTNTKISGNYELQYISTDIFRDFFSVDNLCVWNFFLYIHQFTYTPLIQETIWHQAKCRTNQVLRNLWNSVIISGPIQ